MAALYFIVFWVIGLYIIRLNLELRAYRKQVKNEKEGIYVPSFVEMMERKGAMPEYLESIILRLAEKASESLIKIKFIILRRSL